MNILVGSEECMTPFRMQYKTSVTIMIKDSVSDCVCYSAKLNILLRKHPCKNTLNERRLQIWIQPSKGGMFTSEYTFIDILI